MSEANNIIDAKCIRFASSFSAVYFSFGLSACGSLTLGRYALLSSTALGVAAVLALGLSKGLLLLVSSALVGGGGCGWPSDRRGATLGAHQAILAVANQMVVACFVQRLTYQGLVLG